MLAAFALLLAAATPAREAATEADLRCLAVVASLAGSADAASRAGMAAGAMYFVGKIDARAPGFDYDIELLRLVRSGADLAPDRTRCTAELKARGAALVGFSRGLQEMTRR